MIGRGYSQEKIGEIGIKVERKFFREGIIDVGEEDACVLSNGGHAELELKELLLCCLMDLGKLVELVLVNVNIEIIFDDIIIFSILKIHQ